MKKFFLAVVLAAVALLNADCLGDNPGEVYFKAFIKDNNGNYTRPALYKTTDYGQTAQVVIPDFDAFIHKDKTPGGYYKIPVGSSQLYYSADTCKTWVLKNTTITNDGFQTGVFPGECWKYGYMSSNNNGSSWIEHAGNGVTSQVYNYALGLTQGEAYVYCIDQKLYRTTDYGENYSVVSSLNLGVGGVGCCWQPGIMLLVTSNYQVYYSNDSGHNFQYKFEYPNSWHLANGKQVNEFIGWKINRYPSMVYNQMEIKFYRSTDLGQSWDSVSTNYNVGIEENGEWIVENGELHNYPNPFNNTTLINCSLTGDSHIDLAVYNAKGEIVCSLFKGRQNAGTHQITFNASGLNSGVYYIRAKGKNITQTIKCLLVK